MKVGSLFTGAGGLDMAVRLVWPDAELAWFSEVDRHASAVFAHHHPDVPNLGDITAVDWTTVESVDVIVGGFPCQDISHAGKRQGIEEGTRSGLWYRMADAVRVLRPRLVLVENVAAITTLDGALDAVLGELAEVGFDAEWGVLRASDVGACHQRARWFAVAYPHGEGLEGWDGRGVRERAGQRPARAGDPQPGVTLLATPQARDGKGVPGDGFNLANLARDVSLLPTPVVNDMGDGKTVERWDEWTDEMRAKHGNGNGHGRSLAIEAQREGRWGDYAAAIARWETVVGRPAPAPTDDKGRLAAPFVTWMMGWPDGWTAATGASRSQQLKMLGNGVVPQQAAAAFVQLLERAAEPLEVAA